MRATTTFTARLTLHTATSLNRNRNRNCNALATSARSIIGWNSVVGQWTRIEGKSPSSTDDLHAEPSSGGITMFGNNVNAAPEIIIRECVVLPHKSVSSSVHNEVIL